MFFPKEPYVHDHALQVLMINERIPTLPKLRAALLKAEEQLLKLPKDTEFTEFAYR